MKYQALLDGDRINYNGKIYSSMYKDLNIGDKVAIQCSTIEFGIFTIMEFLPDNTIQIEDGRICQLRFCIPVLEYAT